MPGMAIRNWFVRLIGATDMRAILFRARITAAPIGHCAWTRPSTPRWSGFAATCAPTTTRRSTTRCKAARQVWCAFVFDRAILDRAAARRPAGRVHPSQSVEALDAELAGSARRTAADGVRLIVRHGAGRRRDRRAWPASCTCRRSSPTTTTTRTRWRATPRCAARWPTAASPCTPRKDHVIFERDEVLTGSGKPYTVFTPYKTRLAGEARRLLPEAPTRSSAMPAALAPRAGRRRRAGCRRWRDSASCRPTCDELQDPGRQRRAPQALLDDFLAAHRRLRRRRATTRRSRGRATSACTCASARSRSAQLAARGAPSALQARLARRGDLALASWSGATSTSRSCTTSARRRRTAASPSTTASASSTASTPTSAFAAWCEGRTGYPLVDAAMAQINQTGYMHNRLRMVDGELPGARTSASTGAAASATSPQHLNDYELASNNGGWQWAASTGCDAQPWFRIFNPVTQSRALRPARASSSAATCRSSPRLADDADPRAVAARRRSSCEAAGVELGRDYPRPIVDHAEAREKTLQRYAVVQAAAAARPARRAEPRPDRLSAVRRPPAAV